MYTHPAGTTVFAVVAVLLTLLTPTPTLAQQQNRLRIGWVVRRSSLSPTPAPPAGLNTVGIDASDPSRGFAVGGGLWACTLAPVSPSVAPLEGSKTCVLLRQDVGSLGVSSTHNFPQWYVYNGGSSFLGDPNTAAAPYVEVVARPECSVPGSSSCEYSLFWAQCPQDGGACPVSMDSLLPGGLDVEQWLVPQRIVFSPPSTVFLLVTKSLDNFEGVYSMFWLYICSVGSSSCSTEVEMDIPIPSAWQYSPSSFNVQVRYSFAAVHDSRLVLGVTLYRLHSTLFSSGTAHYLSYVATCDLAGTPCVIDYVTGATYDETLVSMTSPTTGGTALLVSANVDGAAAIFQLDAATAALTTIAFSPATEFSPSAGFEVGLGQTLVYDGDRDVVMLVHFGKFTDSDDLHFVAYDCPYTLTSGGVFSLGACSSYSLNLGTTITSVRPRLSEASSSRDWLPSGSVVAGLSWDATLTRRRITVWGDMFVEAEPSATAVTEAIEFELGCETGLLPVVATGACIGCGPGNASDGSGSTLVCTVCGADTFARQIGSPTCTPCDPNARASPGAALCLSKPGFVPSPANPDLMLRCQTVEACPGGNTCGPGYKGVACADCQPQYYRSSGRCLKCPPSASQRARLLIIIILVLIVLVVAVVSAYVHIKWNLFKRAKALKERRARALTLVGILLAYVQLLTLLSKLDVEWSPTVLAIFDLLSLANLNENVARPECSNSSFTYVAKWFLGTGARIFLILVALGAGWSTTSSRADAMRISTSSSLAVVFSRADPADVKSALDPLNGGLQLATFLYTGLLSSAFEIFDCSKQLDGSIVLDAAASRKCFAEAWWWGMAFAALFVGVVFGLGIPVLFWKSRDSIFVAYHLRDILDDEKRSHIVALFARKFVFIGCLMFLSVHPVYSALSIAAALFLSLGLQLYRRPYVSGYHNTLETFLTLMLIVIMFAAAALASSPNMADGSWYTCQAVVVLCIALSFLAFLVLFVFAFANLEPDPRTLSREKASGAV